MIEQDKEAIQRLELVKNLIKGFETPYGMELLSTVHWIAVEFPEAMEDPVIVVQKVQEWNSRKKFRMKPQHIKKAWQRLKEERWLKAA